MIKEVLTHNIPRERRERLAALAAETIDLAKVSYKTLYLEPTMLIDFTTGFGLFYDAFLM